MIPLGLLLLASSCQIGGCERSKSLRLTQHVPATEESLRAKARSVWQSNEWIIREALEGQRVSDEELGSACDFFYELTGIVILTDMSYVGILLTEYSVHDYERVRDWYKENGQRLYWSEEDGSVILKPRLPEDSTPETRKRREEALKVWTHYELSILRAAHGQSESSKEFQQAWRFFYDLTQIKAPADSTPSGLQPNEHTLEVIEPLRRWYGRHHNDIDLSDETGSVLFREE